MPSKYDFAVAYRIYPGISKFALDFTDDKLEMSAVALESFVKSLGGMRPKIWAIIDGCPAEYKTLFQERFSTEDLEIIEMNKAGNAATFGKQIDILLNQDYSEKIYFAEDDYIYLPDMLPNMVDAIEKIPDADFLSPFNHPDYHNLPIHNYTKKKHQISNIEWTYGASTTMTFFTTKETMRKSETIFRTYCRGNYDNSLWFALTGNTVNKPGFVAKSLLSNKYYSKIIAKAWFHTPAQLLKGKRFNLYFPVPSLSTHIDSLRLAPDTDWFELYKLLKSNI